MQNQAFDRIQQTRKTSIGFSVQQTRETSLAPLIAALVTSLNGSVTLQAIESQIF
jgi:hypothetical protein